jgi:hypothetical protein
MVGKCTRALFARVVSGIHIEGSIGSRTATFPRRMLFECVRSVVVCLKFETLNT